jgi:putative transcriptional regulator
MPKEGYRLVNRVFELRTAKGLTQQQLGDALPGKLARNSVASIETGRYKPGIETAIDLAEFFGVTIGELFFYERIAQD